MNANSVTDLMERVRLNMLLRSEAGPALWTMHLRANTRWLVCRYRVAGQIVKRRKL